jgi:hypothetical protein
MTARLSALRNGRALHPRNIFLLLVLKSVKRLSKPQCLVRLEGTIHFIGNQTRDLLACDIMPPINMFQEEALFPSSCNSKRHVLLDSSDETGLYPCAQLHPTQCIQQRTLLHLSAQADFTCVGSVHLPSFIVPYIRNTQVNCIPAIRRCRKQHQCLQWPELL